MVLKIRAKPERKKMTNTNNQVKLTVDDVVKAMSKHKNGTYVPVVYQRKIDSLNGVDTVIKETHDTIRAGVDYYNIGKTHQQAVAGAKQRQINIANGTVKPTKTQWINQYCIQGKTDILVRFTTSENPSMKPQVTWYLNGAKVSKDKLVGIVNQSELESSIKKSPVYNVKLSNIISIGKEVR